MSSSAKTLRNMPGWLMAAPWVVVACSLLLAALVLLTGVHSGRESEVVTRIFLERGAAMIHGFEAAMRAGMGFRWTDEQLQALIDRAGDSPDIAYLAVTDLNGQVLAASDSQLIGGSMPEPETGSETLWHRPRGHAASYRAPDGKPRQVFQVYRQVAAPQYSERLRPHARHMMEHQRHRMDEPRLTVIVAYDMAPLLEAQARDTASAVIYWSVLAFLGAVGVLTVFLVRNYQHSRRIVQETTAFSFALIDALPLGIVATNTAGLITTLNPEAARITGLTPPAGIGRPLAEALPSLEPFARAASCQETEFRYNREGQPRIPLALTSAPVVTEDGARAGSTLILRDLREIRLLQAEVRRQERLAALGTMAAGVAHEIRNPLSAIKGLARFFSDGSAPDSEEARVAGIMTNEVRRLDKVVGDLLDLARPDALNIRNVRIGDVFANVGAMIGADGTFSGVTLQVDAPDDLPPVELDADRMTQVLLNLSLNAAQAMPEGGLLALRARLDTGADMLALEVEDSGTGIDARDLPHIFRPYYTTKAKGTGLGLALALKIIEAHDGEVDVQSRPGRTVFTVRLPLRRDGGAGGDQP